MSGTLHVVGVRHHSPACARLVEAVLARIDPAVVLIEGPSDWNVKMAELARGHTPPIAIFTHYLTEDGPASSFTPFCAFSPEWVALRWAFAHGKTVRFCDLPSWSKAFVGVQNRYRDEDDRYERAIEALCRRTGTSDLDALWDHLFEGRSPEELEPALEAYFQQIRGDAEAGERDAPREAFMRDYASWALTRGDVVLVCGGYHAPALASITPGGPEPVSPTPPLGGQSHLVPWTYARMDAFAGYQAGMPSPMWWELEWNLGAGVAEAMLDRSLEALRKNTQRPTVADHIAVRTGIGALAALRGHETPKRVDVLDGLLSALIREPLPGPPPWSRRGIVTGDLHPTLATLLRTFTGDRVGRLSAETERPPLLREVHETLDRLGLSPPRNPQTVSLDWRIEGDRERLRVLHRLRLLEIPGFVRLHGPAWGTDARMAEAFKLVWRPDQDPAIIEASRWGSTLEGAVSLLLSHRLLAAESLAARVDALGDAAFVGLTKLAGEILDLVANAVATTPSFSALGPAIEKLLGLWRHGEWLEVVGAPLFSPVLRAAGERSLSLLAGIQGTDLLPADLTAMRSLAELLRHGEALDLPPDDTRAVLARRVADRAAPAMLRGAALGAIWYLDTEAAPVDSAIDGALSASSEGRLGDYLAGLFALARGPALRDDRLIGAVDAALGKLDDNAFLVALPALRLAFSWFPPGERARIGALLAARWGKRPDASWIGDVPADVLQSGLVLDARVLSWGRALGVLE
ncbi:DUF5682 family protein [Polyangium jinanense]|uniref:Uncharacterized protein n=1 Tax=Polyangium jinanense TaxID=2829994 RepID=A0A9X3X375_9BACT|nr:DUF5682 family protein [Polyangium jinanense]MDC3952973.1 hypothetical protein [Polyangium jinanense]MDC3980591.1 hypothetical protein [Polyangium jinanense]